MPPAQKFDKPEYYSYKEDIIPSFMINGNQIKLVSGEVNGHKGILPTASPTVFAHVHFNNLNEVVLHVDGSWELGVYIINGEATIGEQGPLHIGDLALLGSGDEVALKPFGDLGVDVVLLGGEKINYPLYFEGPFVMDSRENIVKAYKNYETGKMGSLE